MSQDYFAMLRDQHRNDFYWRALADVAGGRVLDIGAGTGLLSLMAAKRGADVISVEESADMAQLVRESAQHNSLDQDLNKSKKCPVCMCLRSLPQRIPGYRMSCLDCDGL